MHDLISKINNDSVRAHRLKAMIDNICAKRKPRGIHIHEYKSNQ